MKKSILFLAAFAALVSCVKENPVEENPAVDTPAVEYQTITFEATAPSSSSDDATKTTLVDGSLVHWSNGDQVKVGFFPAIERTNILNQYGVFTANFEETSTESTYFTTDNWAWATSESNYREYGIAAYPDEATVLSSAVRSNFLYTEATTEISYDLPSEQIAVLNSFQSGVNFSYAKVNKADFIANKASLSFINACALLKITLPSTAAAADVKSIAVSSKNDVALSGKFEIPYDNEGYYHDNPWEKDVDPNKDFFLTFEAVAGNPSVSIVAPDGETLQRGGTYYVVVWPGNHDSGLDFEFTNSAGLTCKKSLASSVDFTRAKIDEFKFTSELVFVESPTLELGSETLEMSPTGETKSFTFSVNNDWTVSEDAAWLELDKVSGSASENVSVNATAVANTTSSVRIATITITNTAGLAKTMTVSQNPVTYKVSSQYVAKAGDLKDGQMYAISNRMEPGVYLSEDNGKLSTKQHTTQGTFSQNSVLTNGTTDILYGNEVFIFKKGSKTEKPESYGSWSWGKIQSLSTGMYLDSDLGLNSSSDNAQELVFANKWNNDLGELDGEIDIRKADLTVAFSYNQGLQWRSYSGNERFRSKWVFYEVTEQ